MSVEIVGQLSRDTSIWRYMSLDKLISMLDQSSLFFSCVQSFAHSDPFEGLLPPQLMKLVHDVVTNPVTLPLSSGLNGGETFRQLTSAIFKSSVVNCWHANDGESEAMWKLYGENHRGVAIRSSVEHLSAALRSDEKIKIGRVSYTDYKAPTREELRDCVVSGLGPLLKRKSYSHECEVRAFFLPSGLTVTEPKYESQSVAVCLDSLVQEIVISPFAVEPYVSAVRAIAKNYGMTNRVRASNLLDGVEDIYGFMQGATVPELL